VLGLPGRASGEGGDSRTEKGSDTRERHEPGQSLTIAVPEKRDERGEKKTVPAIRCGKLGGSHAGARLRAARGNRLDRGQKGRGNKTLQRRRKKIHEEENRDGWKRGGKTNLCQKVVLVRDRIVKGRQEKKPTLASAARAGEDSGKEGARARRTEKPKGPRRP